MKSPKQLTEKQFTQQVIDYAHLCGWLVYHTYDSRKSEAGFPDLCLARGGDVVFAELKVGTNTATAAQQAWLDELPGELIGVYLWRPENWPQIQERLR